jgi:acetyl-CoA carboxylase biotin carboxyl carrier protein
MNIKKLKELLDFFNSSGLDELEVKHFFTKVRMVKRRYGEPTKEPEEIEKEVKSIHTPREEKVEVKGEPPKDHLHPVKSPIVGTFYRSPAPGSPPFVEVGDHVEKGQVLCIIEAMKVMNEIESDCSGKIVEILVEDGSPVEYGQVLFYLEPDHRS